MFEISKFDLVETGSSGQRGARTQAATQVSLLCKAQPKRTSIREDTFILISYLLVPDQARE